MEDCSTDERLQQETLCHRQWTDEYVERPETLVRQNVVVVWIQCLLVDVGANYLYVKTVTLQPRKYKRDYH